jgi:hypothetical protein
MARGFSILVNIGATVASSVGASASAVERRMGAMGRSLKVAAAEQKATARQMAGSYREMGMLMAGAGAAGALKKFALAGAEYKHQVSMLNVAGRTQTEVAQAIRQANKTMSAVPTATLADNIKLINETTLAYGGLQHALENLTFNQKMGAMLKNIMGDKAGDTGEMFNQLVRSLELRSGKMSTADYQRQASKLFQAISVSGGTVNPENLLGFAQTAAIPLRGYSEDYMTRVVPSLIQEFGGERAGTVSTAFYNQLMGRVGVGGKSVTNEWIRLGLVPKNGTGGNLSKTGWSPTSLKGYALGQSHPLQWVEQVMFPAMQAHGINTKDPKALLLQAQKMFGRETGKRLASTLMDPAQVARIHADMALYDKAFGPDKAFGSAMANDPKMAMAASAASLNRLETSIGKAITPEVVRMLNIFARGVDGLANAIQRHPRLGKAIGGIFAGIAGLTAIRFGVMAFNFFRLGSALMFLTRLPLKTLSGLLGLFFKTNVVGGIVSRGIGGALLRGLAALGPMILEGLGAAFALLSNPVGWTILAVAGVAGAIALAWHFRKGLATAWTSVVDWFSSGFRWLGDKIGNLPWRSIGWQIADDLTFGMASKLPAVVASIRRGMSGSSPASIGTAARAGQPANYRGRASGGTVSGGSIYEINERGQELFAPGRSGTIIPARATAALIAALSGGIPAAAAAAPAPISATIIIQDSRDPQATARAVRDELRRLAAGQGALLSD